MCHTFLVVTVKMIKIDVYLRRVIAKLKPGFRFFGPPCTYMHRYVNLQRAAESSIARIRIIINNIVLTNVERVTRKMVVAAL